MTRNYLLVRAKPHGEDREDEFKNGTASIGWPMGISFENFTREDLEKTLKKEWKGKTSITQILNFITLKSGDIILTPGINEKKIYIYKVKSSYQYQSQKERNGNPHTVLTDLITTVSYDDIPDQLRRSIKAGRRAVTNLIDYSKDIELLLNEEFKTSKEINDDLKERSFEILKELLDSDNENVKLQAALGILNYVDKR